MSNFLPSNHERLGSWTMDAVIRYYDGPVLFVARDEFSRAYLGFAVDVEGDVSTYLYVPMSDQRLKAIRTGLMSLRDAITAAEAPRLVVAAYNDASDSLTIAPLDREDVPEEWLPEAQEMLRESLETAVAFDADQFGKLAVQENRDLVGIEVEVPEGLTRTELDASTSGALLIEFQELVDSLSGSTRFALVDIQAASFVVVLSPVSGDALFNDASAAVGAVNEMLESAQSEAFGDYLSDLTSRKQVHVRDFLQVLSDGETGITFFAAAASSGRVLATELSLDRVRSGLRLIRSRRTLDDVRVVMNGYLMSINHSKRSFGVVEAEATGDRKRPRRFSGKFDSSVDIEGVPSGGSVLYTFEILRESQISDFDDEEIRYTNRLLRMDLVAQQTESEGTSPKESR